MSTRAIYVFESKNGSPRTVVYIHYDGYPEGAAKYLMEMHMEEKDRGGLAGKFIRANELAEISTDNHGDIAYRYHIQPDGTMTAYERENWDDVLTKENGKVIFSGHYAVFINTMAEKGQYQKLYEVINDNGRMVWMTRKAYHSYIQMITLNKLEFVEQYYPAQVSNVRHFITESLVAMYDCYTLIPKEKTTILDTRLAASVKIEME